MPDEYAEHVRRKRGEPKTQTSHFAELENGFRHSSGVCVLVIKPKPKADNSATWRYLSGYR